MTMKGPDPVVVDIIKGLTRRTKIEVDGWYGVTPER